MHKMRSDESKCATVMKGCFCSDDWDCLSNGVKGPIGMKFKKFRCKWLKQNYQKFWVD